MGILLPGADQGLHFRDSLSCPLWPWKLSTDWTASWPSRGLCSLAAPRPLFLGWRTWLQSRQSECWCSRLHSIPAFEMCRSQKAVAYPYKTNPHNITEWVCLGIFDSAACTGLSKWLIVSDLKGDCAWDVVKTGNNCNGILITGQSPRFESQHCREKKDTPHWGCGLIGTKVSGGGEAEAGW